MRPLVMGVLNVTPDSFSDGGRWFDTAAAVAHGLEMAAEGADVVDVGGESTRPGADPVDEAEELRRAIDVVGALAALAGGAPVDDRLEGSIATATWAMAQGASMVRAHDVAPTVAAARLVAESWAEARG